MKRWGLVILLAVTARLGYDEWKLRQLRQTLWYATDSLRMLTDQYNELGREYSYAIAEWKKCNPIVGSGYNSSVIQDNQGSVVINGKPAK